MITFLQEQVTKSGTFVGASVDVSSFLSDFTIKCKVHGDESAAGGAASLQAGQAARIVIEESVDNFATVRPVKAFNFTGGMSPEGANLSIRKHELEKTSLFGAAGAKARVNLQILSAGSVTYESWVEGY